MILAQVLPNGPEALEQLFLLFVWAVPEFFAVGIGFGACVRVFKWHGLRWRSFQLGIFPTLFGAASFVWFSLDPYLREVWWLKASAILPFTLGSFGMIAPLFRKEAA